MQESYASMLSSRQVSQLDRHMERFKDKGFDTELLSSQKVVPVEGCVTG